LVPAAPVVPAAPLVPAAPVGDVPESAQASAIVNDNNTVGAS
jgi:hypothetical protein